MVVALWFPVDRGQGAFPGLHAVKGGAGNLVYSLGLIGSCKAMLKSFVRGEISDLTSRTRHRPVGEGSDRFRRR
jgi:hypothetical protein